MKKENILLGVIGILAGLIIGYIGTDYLNRSNSPGSDGSASRKVADRTDTGPATAAGGTSQTDVTAAIDSARRNPGDFEAQMKAGGLFREIKRFDQALDFYQNAVKANPQSAEALTRLGDTLFDLQRFDEAAESYDGSLRLNPRNATVRMDLGLCWFLRTPRDLDRAITEFEAALAIDARHEKSLQNLTAALIEKGDLSGARQALERLTAVSPSNPSIPGLRARLAR